MSAEGVRSQFVAAYADVALPDPVEHIVRRGNRIRRARRLRRTAPVVLAAAVLLGVVVLPRFSSTYEPRPIRLVAYEMPRFPLSFRSPPADLDGPRFDLDRVSDPTRRLPTMFYRDRSDPGSQVSVSVRDDKPDLDGDTIGKADVGGVEATVREHRVESERRVTVSWERRDDHWVTVGGRGRYADPATLVAMSRDLVDRPTPVTLQVHLAPAGWELVSYKESKILTLRDPRSKDHTRDLTVYLPERATPARELASTVEGVTGPVEPVRVHGRAAHLVPTHFGWYLQASLPDGTTFVLLAPKDVARADVLEFAGGVSRPATS